MTIVNSSAWAQLQALALSNGTTHLRELFANDARRFERFSIRQEDMLLDFSKQRVSAEVIAALHALWDAAEVPAQIAKMRAGALINHTEARAVLHTALRQSGSEPIHVNGQDVMPDVRRVLEKMEKICTDIHQGHWRGATGEAIRQIINIGIGGSDLGPRMAARALSSFHQPKLKVDFVSNIDAADLQGVLKNCNPATTLFVVASKTFTTQETLQNAISARAWLVAALGEAAVAKHFVALSTNLDAVVAFGIAAENIFEFWDWVGGRFSIWSAIGLPLALAIGMDNFRQFLAGAESMDRHFFTAPVDKNLPATLALLEVWNTNFLGAQTRALLPYSQSLELLPRFLQQMEMESNGKHIDRAGNPLECASAPIVWGEPGTNGQHAFYQLIHQGGRLIPCEFIALLAADFDLPGHHEKLLAHCFAQSEALMIGKTSEEASNGVSAAPTDESPSLAPYKTFPGNQPSTTLLLNKLTPFSLGQLIALYEHKVFSLGVLWNLNSFDQFGVELGKQLAGRLLPMIEGRTPIAGIDGSTAGLIATARNKATAKPQR